MSQKRLFMCALLRRRQVVCTTNMMSPAFIMNVHQAASARLGDDMIFVSTRLLSALRNVKWWWKMMPFYALTLFSLVNYHQQFSGLKLILADDGARSQKWDVKGLRNDVAEIILSPSSQHREHLIPVQKSHLLALLSNSFIHSSSSRDNVRGWITPNEKAAQKKGWRGNRRCLCLSIVKKGRL